MKYIKINKHDNVAVALCPLSKDEKIIISENEIILQEDIPANHKIALENICSEEDIIKYGNPVGHAIKTIGKGEWIHTHNVRTNLSDIIDYNFTPVQVESKKENVIDKTFLGYRRANGEVGIRNEIWIINTVGCVNKSADKIANRANTLLNNEQCDGVYTFNHPYGCSQLGEDHNYTKSILASLIKHPNAGGVIILGLGCENNQISSILDDISPYDEKRIKYYNAQDVEDELKYGVQLVKEIENELLNDKREEISISELKIGIKCGGSDGLSGITANPLVGRISNRLDRYGSTIIMTEIPEMFGAEQLLMDRCINKSVYEKYKSLINDFKGYYKKYNQPIYENPSPGNKNGGITTLEEKSLGAVQKGGSIIINEVVEYGKKVNQNGGVVVGAPGNDAVSCTALTSAGAHLILFTTGRGTPMGFPVPTVKISTNTNLAEKKKQWIDFNAGKLVDDEINTDGVTDELLNYIIDLASGKIKSKNEINDYREIAIFKDGVTL